MQQNFSKYPEFPPDILHSFYSLSFFSIFQRNLQDKEEEKNQEVVTTPNKDDDNRSLANTAKNESIDKVFTDFENCLTNVYEMLSDVVPRLDLFGQLVSRGPWSRMATENI